MSRTKKRTYDQITDENVAALQSFALANEKHKEGWKSKLLVEWMRGNPLDAFPSLYRLRNTHGPSWLDTYELTPQITDEQSLKGATVRGHTLRVWDDGFGPLWVYRETLGAVGVVRAKSWEDAYSCVVDEIMGDADMTDEDNREDADGNLPEGLHHRGSGVPSNEGLESPVASEDLNGSRTELLTPLLALELGIELELTDD